MLGPFAENKRQFASGLISRVASLSAGLGDSHWEIQAQIAMVGARLIPCYDAPSPEHDQICEMVLQLLASKPCRVVLQLTLCHMLPVLTVELTENGSDNSSGNPLQRLYSACMQTLLKMPRPFIRTCLSQEDRMLRLGSASYVVPTMLKEWDPCFVVDNIARGIRSQKLDFIEPEHMEVVAIAITHCGASLSDESERWKAAFGETGLMDYIFVAMCDPDCCDLAIQTLHTFANGPNLLRSLILRSEAFVGALRLLFAEDGDPMAQKAVIAFFESGLDADGPVAQGMARVLEAARPGLSVTPELEKLLARL